MRKGIYKHKSGRQYIVYEDGAIINAKTLKPQKISLKSNGYLQCSAGDIHHLLAVVFIENDDPINKTDVNHKDGNKLNNDLTNLEWVTRSVNVKHAFDNGLKHRGNAYQGGNKKKVAQFNKNNELLNTFETVKDAKEISGLSWREITRCLKGQQKYCKYENIWRYL